MPIHYGATVRSLTLLGTIVAALPALLAPLQVTRSDGYVRSRWLGTRLQDERATLNTGIVKWFNRTKGYGFIQPETGEADAFVHISAVEQAGIDNLVEGQRVEYELVRGRNGKSSAENLKIVG